MNIRIIKNDRLNMLFFLVIFLLIIIVLSSLYYQHQKNQNDNSDLTLQKEGEWLGNSTIFRTNIKMLSYKDALEESKQFIYNIAKIVMQRFAPDQKNAVLTYGKRLLNAGVRYIHVVDIFALSLERKMSKTQSLQDRKTKGKFLGK